MTGPHIDSLTNGAFLMIPDFAPGIGMSYITTHSTTSTFTSILSCRRVQLPGSVIVRLVSDFMATMVKVEVGVALLLPSSLGDHFPGGMY